MFISGSSMLYPTVLSVISQRDQSDSKVTPTTPKKLCPELSPGDPCGVKSLARDCLPSRVSISQSASVLVTRCRSPGVPLLGCPTASEAPPARSPLPAATTRVAGKSSSSRDLKFGIDRILSEDVVSPKAIKSSGLKQLPSRASPYPVCLSGAVLLTAALHTAAGSGTTSFPGCYDFQPCHCGQPYNIASPAYSVPYSMHMLSSHTELYPSSELLSPEDDCSHHRVSQVAGGKRKRSWSRAVFSNLQRKGLEKRFMIQKYITKPDRRQLAATLGLTDAQVKVWFQNRRMKWRHSKEGREEIARLTCSDKNNVTENQESNSRSTSTLDPSGEDPEDLRSLSSI